MATRRKTYKLRGGDVYDVEEYPDGRYGAKGKARQKKKKPTPEQMAAVNQANRAKICRRLLIEYFDAGDYFVTYTYKVEQRPKDMTVALKDLQKALRKLRPKYKKANTPFYWIRNIERGTKGAWHIHLWLRLIQTHSASAQDLPTREVRRFGRMIYAIEKKNILKS
ncbi:hypothetical protein [[Ruminococcus] torques]|uniref:rolling circle replication-associated protein n=1 Tax=[Ruminococcus] torques TaxID=33039 RepID=UPI001FAB30B4|nr:hypothetical protein [[Ruminococcus] torques]